MCVLFIISQTYNNAFHVVDWNLFSPGTAPQKGFLMLLEQMPGEIEIKDLTEQLILQVSG